jgi:hypothetical protein
MDNIPAHLLNMPATSNFADDAVHGLGGVRPPTLSIARQTFTAIDAGGNEKPVAGFDQIQGSQTQGRMYVDVIFIDANKNVSKTYYAGAYDAGATEYSAPDCWSDNGVAPSAQADKPQSPTCAACPHNQWGSQISQTGKQTKACRDAKKVALLIPASGSDMPFLLRIPPASLNKQFAPYIRMLSQQNLGPRKMTPADVVTRIAFDKMEQGVLNFIPIGYITAEQLAQVQNAQQADLTAQIVGKNDTPYQGALPAPAAQPVAQIQQGSAAPQQMPPITAQQAPAQPFLTPQMQQTPQPQPFMQTQPAPQQMPAVAQAFGQQQAPFQQAAIPQQPQTQQEPQRRTRRGRQPTQEAQAQPQAEILPPQQAGLGAAPAGAPTPPPTPGFMMGGAQAAPQRGPMESGSMFAGQPQQAPAQPVQQVQHGMVSAPPPTAELAQTLANAFGSNFGGNG